MLEPYRMVYVNLAAFVVVCFGFYYYRRVFPKKKISYFWALIVLALLPLISILRVGTYESGDLSLHSKFAMDFFQTLTEGNLVPQWAKHMNLSYGTPSFLYMYPFPYYAISLIHVTGLSFIWSIKLYLIITFLLSGIFMYLWIREEVNSRAAFVAGVFYLFTPYHLVDLHFRITVAEMASFTILPLIFLLIRKIFYNYKAYLPMLLSIALSLLILSHQAIIMTSLPLFFAYSVLCYKATRKKQAALLIITSLLFSLSFTAYYWAPVLLEKKYMIYGINPSIFFPPISDFLFSKWRYGFLFQGPIGQLSFVVGYAQILILFASVFIYRKGSYGKHKQLYLIFLWTFIFLFLFIQSFSRTLWEIFPLVKSFQFSYRLLVVIAFSISVIAALVSIRIKKPIFFVLLIAITILSTVLNWGNRRVIPSIDDGYLRAELYAGDPGLWDVTTPKWVNLEKRDKYKFQKDRLSSIRGDVDTKMIDDKATYHSYVVTSKEKSVLKDNTFYYPGWKVFVNKKESSIRLDEKNAEGLIVFEAPKGINFIEVKFQDTFIRAFFKLFSVFSFVIFCFYSIYLFINRRVFSA